MPMILPREVSRHQSFWVIGYRILVVLKSKVYIHEVLYNRLTFQKFSLRVLCCLLEGQRGSSLMEPSGRGLAEG